jgi:hypothetical protein
VAVVVLRPPPHPASSCALIVIVWTPDGVAPVVETVSSENMSAADATSEGGLKVAVAPVGNPEALSVAVQVPPVPVNDTFTELAALVPY